MKYGYARVSTIEQNLERQLEALEAAGCDKIFMDKFSGATLERPQLQELFEIVESGDTIIIVDLTRFSRSTMDLFHLVEEIKEKGVFLRSLNDTWLDLTSDNPYSSFLLTVMSAVSQLERDLSRQRQKEGIAIAKRNGLYNGRPKKYTFNNPQIKMAIELYEGGNKTVKQVCAATGISEATFYRNWKAYKDEKESGGSV